MNKIFLIIQREYLTRVKKKSFIIMTFLGPLLFAGSFAAIIWVSMKGGDTKKIEVLDESGLFVNKFTEQGNLVFEYITTDIEQAKKELPEGDTYGILYIPKINLEKPEGIVFFSEGNPSLDITSTISKTLKSEVEEIKLTRSGIDRETLANLKTNITINTINLTETGEEESNAAIASAVGYVSAFLIYMFIFLYGTQIMRGVVEEKTNRIVEVIISSVKPFQLMAGKIIGIALVGLTQFLLWVILTFTISFAVVTFFQKDISAESAMMENMGNRQMADAVGESDQAEPESFQKIMEAVNTINFPLILGCFMFYFIGGYFLYGSLFAAIGSAVDSDADTQQFMFPIVIPLVFAIASLAVVLRDPDGSFAFWTSIIPFTSPVVMMMRVPFGVSTWELLLSMACLTGGFIFTTWIAGRIYRIGILIHGTKINYKVLGKWIFMKN